MSTASVRSKRCEFGWTHAINSRCA
jgi:hypothetical protein